VPEVPATLAYTVDSMLKAREPPIGGMANPREYRNVIRQQGYPDREKKHTLQNRQEQSQYAKHEKQHTESHAQQAGPVPVRAAAACGCIQGFCIVCAYENSLFINSH